MDVFKILEALDSLSFDELEAVSTHVTNTMKDHLPEVYDKIETHLAEYLKEYAKKGFGLVVANYDGTTVILSPSAILVEDYTIIPYHRDDDEKCEDYGIDKDERE